MDWPSNVFSGELPSHDRFQPRSRVDRIFKAVGNLSALTALDWRPQISLVEGLQRTLVSLTRKN